MWKDPIVEEARKVRNEHAARFKNDLKAICRELTVRTLRGELISD